MWRGGGETRPWPADRVAFLNDVFFCAGGVLRLLRHDAELACGLDFDRPALRQLPRQVTLARGIAVFELVYCLQQDGLSLALGEHATQGFGAALIERPLCSRKFELGGCLLCYAEALNT